MRHNPASGAIVIMLRQLKMHGMAQAVGELTEQGSPAFEAAMPILSQLLKAETAEREVRSVAYQLKTARFPAYRDLNGFDFTSSEINEALVRQLHRCDFLDDANNIVLVGGPGTGKTHLSIALGIKACLEGYTVFFTSVPHLLTQIRECRSQKSLRQLEIRFQRYDMVICDEFGYVSCDKEGGELLFNHLSLRAGKKATIITTNLAFDRWGEIVKDKVLVAAMVDRLTHKAHLISMNGQSYRVKETEKMLSKEMTK